MALYKRIDEILWKDWDPIGVCGASGARDEYRSYLAQVFRLVLDGTSQDQIAEYLFSLETDAMGLSGDKPRCTQIADLMLKTKSKLIA